MAGSFGSAGSGSYSTTGGYRSSPTANVNFRGTSLNPYPTSMPQQSFSPFDQQGFPPQSYSYPAPPITSNVQTPPFTSTAARDPQLQAMYDAWGQYRGGLAAGNDVDAINAMQRQRDLASGMASEMESNAAMRGLGPESGASQYLQMRGREQAGRTQAGLNAALTSDARRQQMAALGGQTGAAQASASDLNAQRGLDISRYGAQTGAALGQQQYGLAQWQAGQQAAQAQAQMQAIQNQNLWNQQMQMMNLANNIYSGF